MKKFLFLLLLCMVTILTSCKKEGCTDSTATNYDKDARKDNGTCIFPDPRTPYLGSYDVTDNFYISGTFVSTSFCSPNISIDASGSNLLTIQSFCASVAAHTMTLSGADFTFTYLSQLSGNYVTVTGYFGSNLIHYEYSDDGYDHIAEGTKI